MVKTLFKNRLPHLAKHFQQPVVARFLYGSIIHIRRLPTAPQFVLKQAEQEYKSQSPLYHKAEDGTEHPLWLAVRKSPERRARNRVLRAIHAWSLRNKQPDDAVELDYGGAILSKRRPVVRVHNNAEWAILDNNFITTEQIYSALERQSAAPRDVGWRPQQARANSTPRGAGGASTSSRAPAGINEAGRFDRRDNRTTTTTPNQESPPRAGAMQPGSAAAM